MTGRPRIGAVYPFWMGIGGVEVHALSLIEHSREWLDWQGISITDGGQYDRSAVTRLARRGLLAGHPLDLANRCDALIVCAYPEAPSWIDQVRCPVIAVSHMDSANEYNRKHLASIRPHAALTIGVSAAAVRGLPEIRGQRIEVIHNGIDLNRIATSQSREQIRAGYGFTPEQKLVGYIGRLSEEKNPLAAALAVSGLGPEYQAVYVGSGLDDQAWIDAAEALAPGRCHFLGALDHVGDVLAMLDCLVMASPAEAGPIVALEAMAAGCPLVATPVGMLSDMLGMFECLPNPPYSSDLSDAVMRCIYESHSGLDEGIRDSISRFIIKNYSARQMAWRWSQVVTDLVTGHQQGA